MPVLHLHAHVSERSLHLCLRQHPGWGMSASSEESGAGITSYAESKKFISVTPQGMNDNTNRGCSLPTHARMAHATLQARASDAN